MVESQVRYMSQELEQEYVDTGFLLLLGSRP